MTDGTLKGHAPARGPAGTHHEGGARLRLARRRLHHRADLARSLWDIVMASGRPRRGRSRVRDAPPGRTGRKERPAHLCGRRRASGSSVAASKGPTSCTARFAEGDRAVPLRPDSAAPGGPFGQSSGRGMVWDFTPVDGGKTSSPTYAILITGLVSGRRPAGLFEMAADMLIAKFLQPPARAVEQAEAEAAGATSRPDRSRSVACARGAGPDLLSRRCPWAGSGSGWSRSSRSSFPSRGLGLCGLGRRLRLTLV